MGSLLTRHRPQSFNQVVGQDMAVRALQRALEAGASHAYLLTGPSGTGKTTLARLAAGVLEAGFDLREIDAASDTGIEEMRAVTESLVYRPMQGQHTVIIVDEAHFLTKQAKGSLLKSLEEPPPWVYWFLCTTDASRIPANIRTRCVSVELQPVRQSVLVDWLETINFDDKLGVPGEIVNLCAKNADGSPRQALANLGVCLATKTREEAAALMRVSADETQAVELARALVKGVSWPMLVSLIEGLKGTPPETVRRIVQAYVAKLMSTTKRPQSALAILEVFERPFYDDSTLAPLYLACGRLAFGSE
jgi:DNA polymerase-3 subunit gamma/tau